MTPDDYSQTEAEKSAIPIKEILENPEHPLHEMVTNLMKKLESGEISLS